MTIWDIEESVTKFGIELPEWLEYDLDCADIHAITHGGCESGAFMPAVTYHIANDTMAKHGDTILEYIEDCLGELPDVTGQSWSGMAVLFFSTAVELLASDIEARLEEIEDSEQIGE